MNALKSLSLIFLFSILFSPLTAQVWGIKLGASFPQIQIEHNSVPDFNHNTKDVNIHGGVSVDIKINKLISIEPGLIFFRKKTTNNNSILLSEYRLTYLNIPIPIKFNIKKGDNSFFGFAGGYLDYGMNGETIINKFKRYETWPKSKEERRLKRTDFGTTFGIGVVFSTLQIEVFSNIGFVELVNGFDELATGKNRNFGITCTLRFGKHGTDFD